MLIKSFKNIFCLYLLYPFVAIVSDTNKTKIENSKRIDTNK